MRRARVVHVVAGTVALALIVLAAGCSDSSPSTKPASSVLSGSDATVGGTFPDTGAIAWPASSADRVAQLTSAAGLQMETHETLTFHVHAHLDVFIDGQHRTVPGGIGIVITDPRVHTGETDGAPAYGGIAAACLQPCISPLHTHDISGVLHTESASSVPNTLGQFFTEWDVRLDGQCVGDYCTPATTIELYVNGKQMPLTSATGLPLTDREEIAIVIGARPARIPAQGDFANA